jgi:hypothetical protein
LFRLQEANVEGALNLTREAKRRSDEAAHKVKQVQGTGGLLVMTKSKGGGQLHEIQFLFLSSWSFYKNCSTHRDFAVKQIFCSVDFYANLR